MNKNNIKLAKGLILLCYLLYNMKDLLNSEDSQIFQAMDLMQFNDINRQKIERVMSVIRKLSLYLNHSQHNSFQKIKNEVKSPTN